jgi:hypothetical protein
MNIKDIQAEIEQLDEDDIYQQVMNVHLKLQSILDMLDQYEKEKANASV